MFTENSMFYKEIEQKADEIVDINSSWYLGEPVIFEEGAREKFTVICPKNTSYDFLIPDHRYMVKRTHAKKESGYIFHHQFWSEIIAYKVGKALGIKTVPAYVAKFNDGNNTVYAAISEWYYNYPDTKPKFTKVSGGDLFENSVDSFDRYANKNESKHNLEDLIEIINTYVEQPYECMVDFADILLLDAIIGNTDRHQSNWEIISRISKDHAWIESFLSPAFDNGTSLGWEILEAKINSKQNNIESYIKKGTHHIKRQNNDKKSIKFINTIEAIKYIYQDMPNIERIETILNTDISNLENDICYLKNFDIGDYSLSDERVDFIISLIKSRIRLFKEIL